MLRLNRGGLHRRLIGEAGDQSGDPIMIIVTAHLTRHGMANRLVVEGEAPRASGASDEPLIRAIACGRAWFEELASGRAASLGEIAERVGVTDRYVGRIVDLAFLAPDVVEAMLAGEQARRCVGKVADGRRERADALVRAAPVAYARRPLMTPKGTLAL